MWEEQCSDYKFYFKMKKLKHKRVCINKSWQTNFHICSILVYFLIYNKSFFARYNKSFFFLFPNPFNIFQKENVHRCVPWLRPSRFFFSIQKLSNHSIRYAYALTTIEYFSSHPQVVSYSTANSKNCPKRPKHHLVPCQRD